MPLTVWTPPSRPPTARWPLLFEATAPDVIGNVKRLFDLIVQDGPQQVAKYDPGVGTEPRGPSESRTHHWCKHIAELTVGDGVAQKLLELYTYLMEQYKPSDLSGDERGSAQT